MQDQPNDSFAPRPASLSVGDYYRNARNRALSNLLCEAIKDRTILRAPSWDEEALSAMLDELLRARTEVTAAQRDTSENDHVREARQKLAEGSNTRHFVTHLTRLSRVADEIATFNTLLHWGWIENERMVNIGRAILEGLDPNADDPQET